MIHTGSNHFMLEKMVARISRTVLFLLIIGCTAGHSNSTGGIDTTNKLGIIINNTRPYSNKLLRGRSLNSPTVTTPECSAIRLSPYAAELHLSYEYSVEFKAGRAVSLTDLQRAIANAVAVQLDMCDTLGRPVFKVKTDTQHKFSDTGRFQNLE